MKTLSFSESALSIGEAVEDFLANIEGWDKAELPQHLAAGLFKLNGKPLTQHAKLYRRDLPAGSILEFGEEKMRLYVYSNL